MTSRVAFLKRSNLGCPVPCKETWSMTPAGTIHRHWYPIIPRWSLKQDSLMMPKTERVAFLLGGWADPADQGLSSFLWGEMSYLRKCSQWSQSRVHRRVLSTRSFVLRFCCVVPLSSSLECVSLCLSGGGLVFFINKDRKKSIYFCLLFSPLFISYFSAKPYSFI